MDSEADRAWHYKAIVIVGVLADEVNPARGAKDRRIGSVQAFKSFYQLCGLHSAIPIQ
jgi:hypothetical protein